MGSAQGQARAVVESHPREAGSSTRGTEAEAPTLTAAEVADYFLHIVDYDAGDLMSNLRLQKMLYYAQAWHLVLTGKPLFAEDFEAWFRGPAIPSVWAKYHQQYGWNAIPFPDDPAVEICKETEKVLHQVWEVYMEYSAMGLERIVCNEDPWKNAREGVSAGSHSTNVIPKSVMKEYYAELAEDRVEDE
jgi:uncharacterized phage-associated protein